MRDVLDSSHQPYECPTFVVFTILESAVTCFSPIAIVKTASKRFTRRRLARTVQQWQKRDLRRMFFSYKSRFELFRRPSDWKSWNLLSSRNNILRKSRFCHCCTVLASLDLVRQFSAVNVMPLKGQ